MTSDAGTYGWKIHKIDDVARLIEQALNLYLEPRHSLFRGDYYNWDGPDGGELILQQNYVEDEGELAEPDFPEHAVLLYASLVDRRVLECVASLEGADLLSEM